jgi:hypothetical protein
VLTSEVEQVFLYRRKLRRLLVTPGTEEMEGVRVNIPLDRIIEHTERLQSNLIPVLTLTMSSGTDFPTEHASDHNQVIEMVVYKAHERWDRISEAIEVAKKRAQTEIIQFPERPVIIDFGVDSTNDSTPELDLKTIVKNDSRSQSKKAEICEALAIEYTPDVWSMCSSHEDLVRLLTCTWCHSYALLRSQECSRPYGYVRGIQGMDRVLEQVARNAGFAPSCVHSEYPFSKTELGYRPIARSDAAN